MIDAVVGVVVMVTATASLMAALEVSRQAILGAGRHPLTSEEKELLRRLGKGDVDQQEFWTLNLATAPQEVGGKSR